MTTEKSETSSELESEGSPPAEMHREQAWEELHPGAYVPIRVRGSWRGGVLG